MKNSGKGTYCLSHSKYVTVKNALTPHGNHYKKMIDVIEDL